MLEDFLNHIVLVASIGALLDFVFIRRKERKKLEIYLESSNVNLSLNEKFSNFLQQVHAIIFERFFHAKFFSLSFFVSAFAISLISFATVISVQIYLFTDTFLDLLNFDLKQICLFGVFLFFNICFDYFTIIQTKIFIEASYSTKSLFNSIIFIVADFLVTVNTFIFSYAFFLLIVASWFVWSPKKVSFAFESGEISPRLNHEAAAKGERSKPQSQIDFESQFEGSFRVILIPDGNKEVAKRITVDYRSNFEPKDLYINAFLLNALFRKDVDRNEVLAGLRKEWTDEIKEIWVRKFPDQSLPKNGKIATLKTEIEINRSMNIYDMYTASLSKSDEFEHWSRFPWAASYELLLEIPNFVVSVMSPRSENLEIEDIYMDFNFPDSARYNYMPMTFCFDENLPQKTVSLDDCKKSISVRTIWTMDGTGISLTGRNTDGYFVPFNTMFFTSILPTVALYSVIALLGTSILIFSYLIKSITRVKKFLLRGPMTVSGFILGAVLSLTGLI